MNTAIKNAAMAAAKEIVPVYISKDNYSTEIDAAAAIIARHFAAYAELVEAAQELYDISSPANPEKGKLWKIYARLRSALAKVRP